MKKYTSIGIKDKIIKILNNIIDDENIIKLYVNNHNFNLYDEWHIDSIDGVEILMELEKEFNISLNENDEYSITKECSINKIYSIILKYIKPIDYES